MIKGYEHVVILKGNLSEEKINEEIKKYENYFKDNNMKVHKFENLGLKKLAYEINNHKEGKYLFYEFSADDSKIADFEKFTRQNENVLKFINVMSEKYEQGYDKESEDEEDLEP